MPIIAGAIVAPEMHMTACAVATVQNCREVRITAEAATAASPTTMTQPRLCRVASTSAPAGATVTMPTIAPSVIAAPMAPVVQPRLCSSTPRNGPMPASMSAMKKCTACSATRSRLQARGVAVMRSRMP